MKTVRNVLFLSLGACLLLTCSKTDEFFVGDLSGDNLKSTDKTVTVPFKADFIGNYTSVTVTELCGDYPMLQIVVDGQGTGTHLGKFTAHFDFCCDNETGIYGPTVTNLVAANGDILYLSCQGQVIEGRLDDHPSYVTSYWRDPFVILGGTGRFEGATGEGMTDDYNSSEDPYSHHHWTGSITLIKGKR
jgi:hypothetical protein